MADDIKKTIESEKLLTSIPRQQKLAEQAQKTLVTHTGLLTDIAKAQSAQEKHNKEMLTVTKQNISNFSKTFTSPINGLSLVIKKDSQARSDAQKLRRKREDQMVSFAARGVRAQRESNKLTNKVVSNTGNMHTLFKEAKEANARIGSDVKQIATSSKQLHTAIAQGNTTIEKLWDETPENMRAIMENAAKAQKAAQRENGTATAEMIKANQTIFVNSMGEVVKKIKPKRTKRELLNKTVVRAKRVMALKSMRLLQSIEGKMDGLAQKEKSMGLIGKMIGATILFEIGKAFGGKLADVWYDSIKAVIAFKASVKGLFSMKWLKNSKIGKFFSKGGKLAKWYSGFRGFLTGSIKMGPKLMKLSKFIGFLGKVFGVLGKVGLAGAKLIPFVGKILKFGGMLFRVTKLFMSMNPYVLAAFAILDGIMGWFKADEYFDLPKGVEASLGQKISSSLANILTLGLLSDDWTGSFAKWIHGVGNAWGDFVLVTIPNMWDDFTAGFVGLFDGLGDLLREKFSWIPGVSNKKDAQLDSVTKALKLNQISEKDSKTLQAMIKKGESSKTIGELMDKMKGTQGAKNKKEKNIKDSLDQLNFQAKGKVSDKQFTNLTKMAKSGNHDRKQMSQTIQALKEMNKNKNKKDKKPVKEAKVVVIKDSKKKTESSKVRPKHSGGSNIKNTGMGGFSYGAKPKAPAAEVKKIVKAENKFEKPVFNNRQFRNSEKRKAKLRAKAQQLKDAGVTSGTFKHGKLQTPVAEIKKISAKKDDQKILSRDLLKEFKAGKISEGKFTILRDKRNKARARQREALPAADADLNKTLIKSQPKAVPVPKVSVQQKTQAFEPVIVKKDKAQDEKMKQMFDFFTGTFAQIQAQKIAVALGSKGVDPVQTSRVSIK